MKGRTAVDFGAYAEHAFTETLQLWFGHPDIAVRSVDVSRDAPDTHGVDLRSTIQSVDYRPSRLMLNWQIKARHQEPNISKGYGEHCFTVRLEPRQVERALASDGSVYVVVARPLVSSNQMLDTPPVKRFDWYAVDLRQYLDRVGRCQSTNSAVSVHIPVRNRLNAAVASLLWGSCWTAARASALLDPDVQRVEPLRKLIDQLLFRRLRVTQLEGASLRISNQREYARYLKDVPVGRREALNSWFGGAVIIRELQAALRRKAGARSYLSYASEASREEINLWIFHPIYREHFRLTSELIGRAGRPKRFLPSPADDHAMPTHLRIAHHHAAVVHRHSGGDVALHRVSNPAAIVERILIPGSGSFRNAFIDRENRWTMDVANAGAQVCEDEEFFSSLLHGGGHDELISVASLLAVIPNDQLRLIGAPPVDLFAKESRVLQHPKELWSRSRFPVVKSALTTR
jgi:hypothetical protein